MLTSLHYYGGKGRERGAWVLSNLPQDTNCLYVEPFAGMLGVLLNRPRAHLEIVGDADGRIMNFWRVIRDTPVELERLLLLTPHSRIEFENALSISDDPIEDARRLAVLISLSVMHGTSTARGHYALIKRGTGHADKKLSLVAGKLGQLAERIRYTQLNNRDGVETLNMVSRASDAIVYCDPPYQSSDTSLYTHSSVDINDLTVALLAQHGRVAVSGYGDEWAHLGWRCEEWETISYAGGQPGIAQGRRIEKLWMNYPPFSKQGVLL